MATKGDDGETDNPDEVGETDQQNKKKKKSFLHAIQKAPTKVANAVKGKKRVAPEDCTSKEEDAQPSALPTGEASRLTSSDTASSDACSHEGMPPLVEEWGHSQTKHSTGFPSHVSSPVSSYPHSLLHSPPATTDSLRSASPYLQTHDVLPLVPEKPVSSFERICKSKGYDIAPDNLT